MPGFGLRISHPTPKNPRGRKSWVVMYRFHGVQRRDTLGRYPGLSLKEARERAGETFESVDRGVDPRAKPPEPPLTPPPETFGAIAEAFVSVGIVSQTGRAHVLRYLEEVRRNLDNHVLPRWAAREAASITLTEVVTLLEAVRVGEPAKPASAAAACDQRVRKIGGPIASNRVLSLLRPLFAWALASGRIDKNPCLTVKKVGEEHKRRRTLGPDKLRDVWFGCAGSGYPFGTLLQTVLVTAQRRTAVARMCWSGLDLKARTWTLTADENKSGRGLIIPLSDLAIELITSSPRKTFEVDGATVPSPWWLSDANKGAHGAYCSHPEWSWDRWRLAIKRRSRLDWTTTSC